MDNPVNKKVVLLITTISSFLAPFMGSSVFIGLPSIGKDFGTDVVNRRLPYAVLWLEGYFSVICSS